MSTAVAETMLSLLHDEGYSLGRSKVYSFTHRRLLAQVDAAKGGQRWCVTAPTLYLATCELMGQLGWDGA